MQAPRIARVSLLQREELTHTHTLSLITSFFFSSAGYSWLNSEWLRVNSYQLCFLFTSPPRDISQQPSFYFSNSHALTIPPTFPRRALLPHPIHCAEIMSASQLGNTTTTHHIPRSHAQEKSTSSRSPNSFIKAQIFKIPAPVFSRIMSEPQSPLPGPGGVMGRERLKEREETWSRWKCRFRNPGFAEREFLTNASYEILGKEKDPCGSRDALVSWLHYMDQGFGREYPTRISFCLSIGAISPFITWEDELLQDLIR